MFRNVSSGVGVNRIGGGPATSPALLTGISNWTEANSMAGQLSKLNCAFDLMYGRDAGRPCNPSNTAWVASARNAQRSTAPIL